MNHSFTTKKHGDVLVVSIIGKILDSDAQNPLLQEIEANISQKKWLIDLSGLTAMNSSGINLLLKSFTKIRNHDGELVLCSLPESIHKLLMITKLNSIFTICSDLQDGLNQLNTINV